MEYSVPSGPHTYSYPIHIPYIDTYVPHNIIYPYDYDNTYARVSSPYDVQRTVRIIRIKPRHICIN